MKNFLLTICALLFLTLGSAMAQGGPGDPNCGCDPDIETCGPKGTCVPIQLAEVSDEVAVLEAEDVKRADELQASQETSLVRAVLRLNDSEEHPANKEEPCEVESVAVIQKE